MKRALLVIVSSVVVSAVATVSVVWFAQRPPASRNSQVVVDSVSFGLSSISTPTLDDLGVECVPKPVPTTGSNEEWPDGGVTPDPYHREALAPELREVFDCLVNCLPTDPAQWEGPALSSSRPCFEDLVVDIALKLGYVETFLAMGSILRTYPKLTFFCHEAGHKSGEAAFKAGVPLETVLPVVGDYCVHGAMHGILDGFGLSNPSLDDFAHVASICTALKDGAAGGCTDGMGHAAWDAFESFDMTTKACATIAELELRYSCDEGVLMRRYERTGRMQGVELEEYQSFTARLRADCTEWEQVSARTEEPGGPGGGCWAAVQYMLWEPLVAMSRIDPDKRWRTLENFQELLDEMRATCASFGPTGEDLCRGRDGYHVASASNYNPADFEDLCRMLEDRVERCVEMAHQLTKNNSGQ